MTGQTTVRFRDGQHDVIQEIERVTHIRSDVPKLRQSEILRRLFDIGIETAELTDLAQPSEDVDPEQIRIEQLIGEAEVARYRHNRFKELDGWLRNQRTGYRTQVKRVFVKRFKNGYSQDEIEEFAENYRQKAHYLWPGEEHQDDREEALEYVDAVLSEAKRAIEGSDRDPLDPEQIFARFEGVERGQQRKQIEQKRDRDQFEDLINEAASRLRPNNHSGGNDLMAGPNATNPDPEAVSKAMQKQLGITEEEAEEAVEKARERINGGSE